MLVLFPLFDFAVAKVTFISAANIKVMLKSFRYVGTYSFHTGSGSSWHNKCRSITLLWIRIRSDPELFAGSGSGINNFGSGSGQHD